MLRFEATLVCTGCSTQRVNLITEEERHLLQRGDLLALMCSECHTVTDWDLYREDRRHKTAEQAAASREQRSGMENRHYGRVRLHIPIEFRYSVAGLEFSETTATVNISRTGVYFLTAKELRWGMKVTVVLPRTVVPDPKNPALNGKIVRIDRRSEEPPFGVAVELEGVTLDV